MVSPGLKKSRCCLHSMRADHDWKRVGKIVDVVSRGCAETMSQEGWKIQRSRMVANPWRSQVQM